MPKKTIKATEKQSRDWLPIILTIIAIIISSFAIIKYYEFEKPRLNIAQSNGELESVCISNEDNNFIAIFSIKISNPSNSLMTIDTFNVDSNKIQANEYLYRIATEDFVEIKEFRLKHSNPVSSITYSIYPKKYLLPRFEIGPGKIEEGYVVIKGYSSIPVTNISLTASTPHGEIPFTITLMKSSLVQ